MTARDIAGWTGGRLTGRPDAVVLAGRADSRLCRDGDLYVALPGERTDGHLHVTDAWAAGASTVLADEAKDLPSVPAGKALIGVPDPLTALQEVARVLRNAAGSLRVAAITGSNGKTTTKDILASIMKAWIGDDVLTTRGNYNSDIGLPLMLLELRPHHRMAVLEMGMNRPGEIALLAGIARPAVAVVTNIGSAHVGLLGSREAIAREKRHIFDGAGPDSVAVVPADEPWNPVLLEGYPGSIRRFGESESKGWDAVIDRGLDGWDLRWRGAPAHLSLPGRHSIRNAMAAVEAALALGAPEEAVVRGLSSVEAPSGRSQVVRGALTVVRDYYNANPESLQAALDLVSGIRVEGRLIVVLGELRELGSETEGALRAAGGAVAAASPDAVYLFGDDLVVVEEALRSRGFAGALRRYAEIADLRDALASDLRPGDLVLLKGSRGSELERLDDIVEGVGSG